jgi:hypothetical protein
LRSGDYGNCEKIGSNLMENARISNALKDQQSAAAAIFYSTNQTSLV